MIDHLLTDHACMVQQRTLVRLPGADPFSRRSKNVEWLRNQATWDLAVGISRGRTLLWLAREVQPMFPGLRRPRGSEWKRAIARADWLRDEHVDDPEQEARRLIRIGLRACGMPRREAAAVFNFEANRTARKRGSPNRRSHTVQ